VTAAGIADRGPSPGAFAQVRAGLARIAHDPVLRVLVITVAIMATANAATDAVLVVYATQSLDLSEAVYPTLLAAYSVGILAAAALAPRLVERLRGGQVLVAAALGIGVTMLVLGFAPVPWVAWLSYAVMGVAGGTFNVLVASRRQRQTPHDMIARVSSAFRVAAWGFTPVGAALGGVIGERAGVPTVFVLAGAVIVLTVAVAARSFLTVEPAAGAPRRDAP
jgi:MFS family permease